MAKTVSDAVRAAVLTRCGMRCERCGLRMLQGLHVSHRQARGMGGARRGHDRLSNLNALCPKDHLRFVEVYPDLARREGWKVRDGYDTTKTAVLMWDGWHVLDDDGGRHLVVPPLL